MTSDPFSHQQDRRSFLKAVGASGAAFAALACTSGSAPSAAAAGSASRVPSGLADRIGVQLYSVRDRLEKDFVGTLEGVAKIGFKEVEFAGYYNHSPEEVR